MSKNKTVLLLGATGGVGEAAAKMLMQKGYFVILNYRNETQKAQLEKAGLCNMTVELDLARVDTIEKAFEKIKQSGINELDGIINCAAIQKATPLEEVPMDEVDHIFKTNVFGTLRAVQLAIPMLRPRKGRIVLCGSLAGSFVMPLTGIYSASKYALEAIVDSLRRELYPWGIEVSLVKPGSIDTRMFRGHIDNMKSAYEQSRERGSLYSDHYLAHVDSIPKTQSKIMGTTPEEVATMCLDALESSKPKTRYFPSFESKATRFLTPFLTDRMLDKMSAKYFFPLRKK